MSQHATARARTGPRHAAERPQGGKWWPLVAVAVAIFMLLVDVTIVNVALPDIEADLSASFSDLQWVIDAYALTLAAFLLTAGSVGDRVGRKKIFVVGIAVFALASLGCGLSTSPGLLTACRAVQGVGGAIMFATSLALLASSYSGRDRGVAFGVFGAVTGASVAIGPLVGGLLVTGLSWRWIFFVNLPVAALAIAVSVARLRESRDPQARGVDVPGLVTFSLGLALLVFGLIRGNDQGWSSTSTLLELGGALVLLVVFVVVQARRDDPMLDLRLFRRPAFVGAQVAAFAVSAALFSLFLYLTLYLQNVLGYSALETGVRLLAVSGMSFVVAPIAGRLTDKVPFRVLIPVGLALLMVGLLLMRGLDGDSAWTALLPGFLVAGAGIGMVNAPLGALAVGVVEQRRSGMASGINNTFRQVGIATGTAAFGALFAAHITDEVGSALAGRGLSAQAQEGVVEAVTSGAIGRVASSLPAQAQQPFVDAAREAFTSGMDQLFLVGAVVAGVGAVLCAVLIRQRDLDASSSGARPQQEQPSGEGQGDASASAADDAPDRTDDEREPVPAR
ncbi:MFS transporter [Pseudokineococcus basanitobsidens]|uniref:MFS transporter n=1 Tax=Pseudokineococcus basanitobsidens TaxID=1926649 RepID=A0ABU8RMF7_9ACTN